MSVSFRRAKSTDKVVDLKTFNDMQIWLERVANMTTDQYFNLTKGDPNYMLYSRTGASSTMSYSDWAFGFSISGAVVTINSGKVRHGTRTAVTAAGKDITISADQTWVFVAYTYGSTATITSSTTEPIDTKEVHNHALFLVTLTAGVASVEEGDIKSLGDIFIPGSFA